MSAVENTLLIIKPKFVSNKIRILQLMHLNGFRITHRKTICFSPEQAAEFYKEFENTDELFAIKVMALSSGPSEAIILNKFNAVNDLLNLKEFPSEFGDRIHASASKTSAINEIKYIFPNVITEPSRKVFLESYCGTIKLTRLLAGGILKAAQSKVQDPREFLSSWLSKSGNEFELIQ